MTDAPFDAHRYWSERLAGDFSLDGVGWQGLGEGYNRWMYAVRRRLFMRTVRSHLRDIDRATILDVGSGTGFYVDTWHQLGAHRLTGSDLTAVAVEQLGDRFPGDHFVQLDITARDIPDDLGGFDAISAIDVLFHIVDDDRYRQAIENLSALLHPTGVLILSENFLHGQTVRTEHQASRSRDWIASRLHDAGLELVSRRPMFVLMNTPIDSRSRLLALWWRSLTSGLHRWPRLAPAAGMVLSGADLALTRVLREGPSTELVVCRRRSSPAAASS